MADPVPLRLIALSLRDVVTHCGMETAEALVGAFAGTRIWVPKVFRPGHDLAAIGEEAATRLCAELGGAELSVPGSLYTLEGRSVMIRRLRRSGLKHRAIALQLGISERTVRDELSGKAPVVKSGSGRQRRIDERQTDLVDYLARGGRREG